MIACHVSVTWHPKFIVHRLAHRNPQRVRTICKQYNRSGQNRSILDETTYIWAQFMVIGRRPWFNDGTVDGERQWLSRPLRTHATAKIDHQYVLFRACSPCLRIKYNRRVWPTDGSTPSANHRRPRCHTWHPEMELWGDVVRCALMGRQAPISRHFFRRAVWVGGETWWCFSCCMGGRW